MPKHWWIIGLLLVGLGGAAMPSHPKAATPKAVTASVKPAAKPSKTPSPVLQKIPSPKFHLKVDVTYYQALPGQTDADFSTAACGPNLEPWVQVAVSRDLFYDALGNKRCGQQVRLHFSNGQQIVGVINDTMNPRFSKRIDVLVANHENALAYGRKVARLEWMTPADDI